MKFIKPNTNGNGSYGPTYIEQITDASDCIQLIQKHVQLEQTGTAAVGRCPKCGRRTLIVRKKYYMCANAECDMGGNAITWLMRGHHMSLNDACDELIDEFKISVAPGNFDAGFSTPGTALDACEKACCHFQASLPGSKGEAYLRARGITPQVAAKFRLGFDNGTPVPDTDEKALLTAGICAEGERGVYDRFRGRVIFPVLDEDDMVIGFGGRIMNDSADAAKYINSPETAVFDKGRQLYGMNFAKRSERNGLILCEGYMDVIAMHSAGFDNTVAALGTALTSHNAGTIRAHADAVCLMFDADEAGSKATMKAIRTLEKTGIGIYVVRLKGAKDPDEFIRRYGRAEMEKCLHHPMKVEQYIVFSAIGKNAPGTTEANAALSEVADTLSDEMLEKAVRFYNFLKKQKKN